MNDDLVALGWREWVHLPDLGGWVKAKVDTGAKSSSLHAFDLEEFEKKGATWVRFSIQRRKAKGSVIVDAPLLETRVVKNSSGATETRPVIRTTMSVGDVEREIEVTLTRRDQMGYRMLLGREALRDSFQVDPKRSFVTGRPPKPGQRPPFYLSGTRIDAGTQERLDLPIARLASGPQVSLPILVLHGKDEGPTVWLSAAVHGDEICGTEVIRRVLNQLDPETLRGTVMAVPVVNVHGFISGDRNLPDRRDLNRSFPGSARGSLARRIAHLFMTEVVARCSVGIDLHTGSDGRSNLPQIRADLDDPTTLELATAFGAPIMVSSAGPERSLRQAATKAGASVLLFEGGEAWRFDPAAIDVASKGVLQVLAELDMIKRRRSASICTVRGGKTRWVRARKSGLTQLSCNLGDVVEKGQLLGRIHDSFGERLSRLNSPMDGMVIGQRIRPLVNRGDGLIHIAEMVSEE